MTRLGKAWIAVAVMFGLTFGLAAFTFGYAKGYSYLTNDPAACANCHVMSEQYAGWVKSSHRNAAACNDCHTPPGLVPKYYVKAKNGFWHSFYFTFQNFHEPIQITAANREVTEQACRKCHGNIVEAIDGPHAQPTPCIRCHSGVGHLEATSVGRSHLPQEFIHVP